MYVLPRDIGRKKAYKFAEQLRALTLSECLFFFGIYSFYFGGRTEDRVFQFLEAATPFPQYLTKTQNNPNFRC